MEKRAITKNNFIYLFLPESRICKAGRTHLLAKHLLFPSSCEVPSSPQRPQPPTPFSSAQDGVYVSCLCVASVRLKLNLRFSC